MVCLLLGYYSAVCGSQQAPASLINSKVFGSRTTAAFILFTLMCFLCYVRDCVRISSLGSTVLLLFKYPRTRFPFLFENITYQNKSLNVFSKMSATLWCWISLQLISPKL